MTEEKIFFRVAEKITYGGKRFFVPQIFENEDWMDIDFDDGEYFSVAEGYGGLKCESMYDAITAIKNYCREKEEELKEVIKEIIYHYIDL